MLQNTLASAGTSRLADTDPHDLLVHYETCKIVTCSICQAVYRPALSQQEVAQSSSAVLEAAFLRVCHFCFRCQRPACPQCWNPIHAVCVACGKEACLPFLSPVPSLQGLVFAPFVFPHLAQADDIPFSCLRNGRFVVSGPSGSGKIPAVRQTEAGSCFDALTPVELPGAQAERTTEASNYPSWLQEIMDRRRAAEPVGEDPSPACDGQQLANTQEEYGFEYALVEYASTSEESSWAAWWQERPQQMEMLAVERSEQANEILDISPTTASEELTPMERIENVLIVIMSILLLALIVIIVLSLRSASMNEFFLRLLHVDIRSEIAYLFQSI